ncbi:MAG: methyltransferase domain-containing protein [Fibrobacterota bacterium]
MNKYQHRAYELLQEEKRTTCGGDSAVEYEKIHRGRFQRITDCCKRVCPGTDNRVLDIGRSGLTQCLSTVYTDITTLGFPLAGDTGGHRERTALSLPHITYDLRRAEDPHSWPEDYRRSFDLIVYSEVMEHLPIAPEYTLLMFATLLRPGGKILVTTPNRADIRSRLRLLLGRNPEGRIRYFSQNPGHFREYTLRELDDIGKNAFLTPRYMKYENFGTLHGDIFAFLRWIPSFKDSLIAVFENTDEMEREK